MTTKAELRETYLRHATEELLELRSRDALVPEAYEILDEILLERGVDPTAAIRSFRNTEWKASKERGRGLDRYLEWGVYLWLLSAVCAVAVALGWYLLG